MLEVGQKAPDFKVLNDENKEVSLSDFLGQKIVLYFYPKDDTSGCTKEACNFRDQLPAFQNLKAVILGVSKDNVASHQKFKAKYDLPFMLLADEKLEFCQAYGVWVDKSMYGKTYKGIERSTFLINEKGIIAHIWRKVKVEGHDQDVLKIIGM
ncbi:MAG: thioredoxin-dependent thiol peroxidase [Alphaproteobacteria bacterium]|nr:thioredoxin-dependent thiol peroxidase [Alphaproteobacteria bacterium]